MDNPTIDNAESVKNPSPFITFTARTIPATFDTSMSYQEALFALVNYLQTQVTPAINENAKITDEQTKVINELYDFVNHYFENLDVQEEINNKLDEMVESGELEAILQQILNTLRVYDTVADMIADEAIQNGQRVMCFGYAVKTDNGGGTYTITNQELSGNGLTIIELDNGLFAVKEYSDKIVVADQSVLTNSLLTELLNNSVEIVTENPIEVTETITISQEGATIKNMEFVGDLTQEEYIIRVNAEKVTIENCKLSGVAGNYIRIDGDCDYCTIEGNTLDGTNGNMTSGLVAWGAKFLKIHGNTFINLNGFNNQLIKCSNCNINDNSYHNDFYQGSYETTGGETVIQFNTNGVRPHRYAVRIDGTINNDYTLTFDRETSVVTLTFNNAIQGVKNVSFRCYATLEIININSHCKNITITSNNLEGSGDSGIVVGADYHNGALDPSNVISTDVPVNVTIASNTIRNCLYAGIGITHSCPFIVVENNIISNYGYGNDGIWSSGVFIPLSYRAKGQIISNNTFSNSSTNMYGETETGIGKYGVCVNPASEPPAGYTYDSYMQSNGVMRIENNSCDDTILLNKFYAFSNTIPQVGMIVSSVKDIDLGLRPNTTVSATDNWGTISAQGGSATATTENSANIINIAFNESGDRYCDVTHRDIRQLENCQLVIEFLAKSDVADNGAFYTIYNAGVSKAAGTMKLTNTWKAYQYRILIAEYTGRDIYPRFIPTGTCRNIKIKDFRIKAIYYNN